jgi:predicted nucleic acid-binding Zn ribbon protein
MQDLQRPKINLRDCPTIKCESCGSIYFREVIYLKKVSKIMTGDSEDTTVPFPIYKCDDCGHINEVFNPFEGQKTITDGE